jgi:hypothetical protein
MSEAMWNDFFKRAAILLVLAAGVMFAISEGVFLLRKDRISRAPTEIRLVIPQGASQTVAAGLPVSNIPEEMIFVIGDTLIVQNYDTVAHELGPLWVPPGQSASLNLDMESEFAYSCSFTPTNYFGLTVKEATTWKTRLIGLWYGVPPLFMFFLVYSYLVFPPKKNPADSEQPPETNESFQPQWGWRQFDDFHEQTKKD